MRKAFDKFNFTATFGESWDVGARTFVLKALFEARKYDIIHVHSLDKIVPPLKNLYGSKPVVLHYHGVGQTELWAKSEKRWRRADAILIFGSDQMKNAPPNVQVSETPVDTDIFHPMAEAPVPGTALYIKFGEDELAEKLCQGPRAESHGPRQPSESHRSLEVSRVPLSLRVLHRREEGLVQQEPQAGLP